MSDTRTDAATTAPIHPGEMLMEDFLAPFGISNTDWLSGLGFPRAGSMRSSTELGGSAPTPLCASPGTLERATGFG
jgi:hypothetical protein